MDLYRFPSKRIRSEAIRDYMRTNRIEGAVCLSCGNASRELRLAGLDVIDISPTGDMTPNRWFTQGEVARMFPDRLDATSGHLPNELMVELSHRFRDHLGRIPEEIALPTGSGETLVALKMAFPKTRITAVYDLDGATEYSPRAPLNKLVELLADKIIRAKDMK